MKENKSQIYGLIVILLLAATVSFFYFNQASNNNQETIETTELSPEEVITLYFESWNKGDYKMMYSLFSDGFKDIAPTAKTLESFEEYASLQAVETIEIDKLTERFTDESTSVIDYSVTFILNDGTRIPFESEFTLRYRDNDKVPGWKMIHPYGDDVDTS